MGWMWVHGLDALGFRFRNYSRFSQDLEKWQQHIQSIEVSRQETNRKIFLKSWRLVLVFLCRVCTGVVGGALLNYDRAVFSGVLNHENGSLMCFFLATGIF